MEKKLNFVARQVAAVTGACPACLMKHYLFLLFSLLFIYAGAMAQTSDAGLLVQSPDGRTVKLVWHVAGGDTTVTGFDIKRKEGLAQWVKLNSAPIMPGITHQKDLAIAESDNGEQVRIKDKLAAMLKSGRIKETDSKTYLQQLSSHDTALAPLQAMIARDYDVALLAGYGYVDHTVANKTSYEYGLYAAGTDVLLGKATWNYGEIPDLNVVRDIATKWARDKSGITLMWDADAARVKEGHITGFNIYRQGIRLNELPVAANGDSAKRTYVWQDRSANGNVANQYSISAESVFGIEGTIRPYTYNPEEHIGTYKKAEVTLAASAGYYFKDGLNIQWAFPKDAERFVKGFYVEKDNMPQGYKRVSKLLDPAERAFNDKSNSQVNGYIKVRVVAVYSDRTEVPGIEKLYTYFPTREPPIPTNAKLTSSNEGRSVHIKLAWDPRINGDSITEGYLVYKYDQQGNNYSPVGDRQVMHTNSYSATLPHSAAATYRYYITAITRAKTESQPSDTVQVHVGSLELPAPVLLSAVQAGSIAIIKWECSEVSDIKGFRLYQGADLVADESVLKSDVRSYATTGALQPATTYSYSVMAVSESGVVSEPSEIKTIAVPAVKAPAADYR